MNRMVRQWIFEQRLLLHKMGWAWCWFDESNGRTAWATIILHLLTAITAIAAVACLLARLLIG